MHKPDRKQQNVLKGLKQIDPNLELKWEKVTGVPVRIRGKLSGKEEGDPEKISRNFLNANKNLFIIKAPEKEMKLKNIVTDRAGYSHVRYQQMYKEIPVFGQELLVHIDSENVVRGVNGKFTPGIDLPTEPKLTDKAAIKAVLAHDSKNDKNRMHYGPKLMVFVDGKKEKHLVWHITIDGVDEALDGSKTPAKWEYFVDSFSGEILWRYNNEQMHTRTTGTGVGKYAGNRSLNTLHNDDTGKYTLEDRWVPSSARIITHDADSGFPPAPASEDSNNNWSAVSQGAEVDCHVYTRMVFDYFLLMHGRNSYDDAGADMNIYAHCGSNWNNASWNGSYVKIGDGNGVENSEYCTLDIVAHEWTHAVTEYSANLIYYGESGALNESMSDVFAALIDGNWLQGEDNWLKTTAPAGRNLQDPTNGGQYDPANPIDSVIDGHQPDHIDDKYTGANDNGGVHINSGIMNKVAYLIATGGAHRGINICEGLGREVLGRLYYEALTGHLLSDSDFSDMRDAVLDSLQVLYEGDPRYARWRASIINAFAAVGIGTAVSCPIVCWIAPGICPPSPHIICPPSPGLCPPSPSLCPPAPHIICPPSPSLCPPAPHIICPPAPVLCPPAPLRICPPSPLRICPPGPGGCLPGPDPLPFIPKIKIRNPVKAGDFNVEKISGIGPQTAKLLKSRSISTIAEFLESTEKEGKLKEIADSLSISETNMRKWRKKAKLLLEKTK